MEDLSNEFVVHVKKENCEYLQFRKLLNYSDIKHAYGLKPANYRTKGQNVTPEMTSDSLDSYKILCDSIGADYNKLIKPNQKHTNIVKIVEHEEQGIILGDKNYENTDGLVTDKKEVVLATTNADCTLIMLYDPIKGIIGNVHSGWRGTFQKIVINAINTMINIYGSNPSDIICCICPTIRKCHFEVEKDVKDMCTDIFSYTNKIDNIIEYAGKKDGIDKWMIDNVLINKLLLQEVGINPENIIDCGICSVCNSDKIHSYRVEKNGYGLCTAVISMK